MTEPVTLRRCAIYVRKSSDEGLDMSYNSLEAQADACTAYVASQRHEGWTKLPKVYEDGGYSGGTMERPGLKELLKDVDAGKIDIIVVYKIDRLTRSLTDFAKLNDVLDRHQVSFVAVTQQFNTSTSMGRLTLNVLLSFAQFEREVAGERIRDKVAASKKKGMWMGGPVPLGYAVKERKLEIVSKEAEIVRNMFARYLELRSVHLLQRELEQQGVRSRIRSLKDGRTLGGIVLGRGAISHMLKNPFYIGMIRHAGEHHVGLHEAIIDRALFDQVQEALTQSGPGEDAKSKCGSPALLKGLVSDADGSRMQPTHAVKNGVRYRYYTSARRLRAAREDPGGIRVPAGDLERIVVSAIVARLKDAKLIHRWLEPRVPASELPRTLDSASGLADAISTNDSASPMLVRSIIGKIMVSRSSLTICLLENGLRNGLGIKDVGTYRDGDQDEADGPDGAESTALDIIIPSHMLRCGKQVKLVLGADDAKSPEPHPKLVEMVLQARRWFAELSSGTKPSMAEIALATGVDRTYVSRLITLAFLAPDLVERIITGNHAATLTPERLRKACPLPQYWDEQRALLLG